MEKLLTAGLLVTGYHRKWARAIDETIDRFGIEALHVHDLSLLGTAIVIGKRRRIPVVADLHENYPALVALARKEPETPWYRKVLNSPRRWRRYEKRWLHETSRVIVVVEEARSRLMKYGISKSKITVVENLEDISQFTQFETDKELVKKYSGDFVVLYVGGIDGPHRGIKTAIEAMPHVCKEIPEASLLIVGDGYLRFQLEAMASRLPYSERITFAGWHPLSKVPTFINLSAVCLVPHLSNELTESTNPHKLSQYMLLGKPVVVSSCGPLQRVVEKTGAGLVFHEGDSLALAHAIIRLKDTETRKKLGEAGRVAVNQYYNWKVSSNNLLMAYDEL